MKMFNWFSKDAEVERLCRILEKSSTRERDLILRLDSMTSQLHYREKELAELKSKESDQFRKDNGLSLLEGAITWANIKRRSGIEAEEKQKKDAKISAMYARAGVEERGGFIIPLPKKPGRKPKVKILE